MFSEKKQPMTLRIICFLSLLLGFTACEKVKDSPQPDPISEFLANPVRIELRNQREAELQFFTPQELQNLQGQVSVEIIRQPRHGSITADNNRLVFIYKANEGWFGSDTAAYRVCSAQSCRDGQIYISLSDSGSACNPLAPDLNFVVSTGSQLTQLPASFPCGAFLSEITDNPAPGQISLSGNNLLTSFPEFTVQTFSLGYRICNNSNRCDTGRINLIIRPDSSFCRSRFMPADDNIYILSNVVRRSVHYDSLFLNDPPTCPDDLIYESLAIVSGPSHGSAELRSNVQGRFIRYTRNPAAQSLNDSLQYSVQSRSGKTALVKLCFKVKP